MGKGGTNRGGPTEHEPQHEPIPRDEISAIAGRILGSKALSDDLAKADGNARSFNKLLADAKKLAGFVLNADPEAGPNRA